MMFLLNTVSAEVEPVPGKDGWFQLTGRKILRHTDEVDAILPGNEDNIVADPKIYGIHDVDPEIALRDPRFNHENDLENEASFAVLKNDDGTFTMYLLVNRAEFVLFRFLAPHEAGTEGDEEYDPIGDYRIEKKPAKAKTASPVKAKAPAKKAPVKRAKAKATA